MRMSTSAVISKIKTIKAAFSVIAALNLSATDFPRDAQVFDGCRYDYVIVGGGIAGSVVSARLVEAGHSVLVIEAGGLPGLESSLPGLVTYLKNSRTDWNYTAEAGGSIGCHKSSDIVVSKDKAGCDTSAVISKIKSVQAAFGVIAALNFSAPDFPPDAQVSNGCNYDYVIVGGGVAGSVVSARLVEAGHSVLVIEAGGLPVLESSFPGWVTYLKNSRTGWNFTTESDGNTSSCHKSNSLVFPKGMGGIGTTDYMFYNRGSPSDYDKWSEDGSWNWQNMMKYFKKSESLQDPTILNSPFRQYHGIDGKIRITREPDNVCDKFLKGFKLAGQPTPLDNIGNRSLGYSRALYYIFNGLRTSVSEYITPIKDNPNIRISLHSLATKIAFDDKKNAVGVEFIKNGNKITVKAKKEVIISAGTIKSPQLLLLSGIGSKKQLKQFNITCLSDLPVGQNFQNVNGAYLAFKTNRKADPKPFDARRYPTPLVLGYAATNQSYNYETLNFIIDDYDYFLTFCGFTLNFDNKICDKLYRQAQNTQLLVTVLSNLNPKSRGQILLNSADPEDSPKITTGYKTNNKDLDAVVEEIQHYLKVVSTPYFKDMGLEFMDASKCSQHKKGSREYWLCYAVCMRAGTGRYIGTNSMGAVVDTKLCVKGMNKLRVVDASVIPSTISGSIAAVIVAIAEKAAEIILSDVK